MKMQINRLPDAKDLPLPKYMTRGAAGMDLYANVTQDLTLAPGDILAVSTGIAIALPQGYEAQIRPRSGLALKFGISMVNSPGTIDSDYRGEIKVIMVNLGKDPFPIKRGDRIAQMVVNRIELPELFEVEELSETDRGDSGFGSTGV